jgi:Mrp family chromosome partitioning ATPase
LDISLTGIVAIVGNYGSGKTEVAINLAVNCKRSGLEVRIADLDLVNPYFRTREAENALEALGIKVILPPREFLHADLPILSPAIAGMVQQPDGLTLLDVGGDDAGATVKVKSPGVVVSIGVPLATSPVQEATPETVSVQP